MPPKTSKKHAKQQMQSAAVEAPRRSTKRAATRLIACNDMTEDEARSMFNQLPRRDLEDLFLTVFNESIDAAEIVKMNNLRKRRKVEDGRPVSLYQRTALGNLGCLPNELLDQIFSYIPTKQFIALTSEVCKGLQGFRWSRPAWETLDTNEIPYNHLIANIMPQLSLHAPEVIKHAKVVYKQNLTPKTERFLQLLAAGHTPRTLSITQPNGVMTVKRLEVLQKLMRENRSMQKIVEFSLKIGERGLHYRDNVIRNAEMAIELAGYWPELQAIHLEAPGGIHERLGVKSFRLLSEAGSEVKPGLRSRSNNYITRLTLIGGMEISSEILVRLGTYFPELQTFRADNVGPTDALDVIHKDCANGYIYASHMPRLESLEVNFGYRHDHKPTTAISTFFFSLIHQAPNIRHIGYKCEGAHNDKLKLFEAIRKWRGGWKGSSHDTLTTMKLRGFALEWKLLGSKGAVCSFNQLENIDGEGCVNIERDLAKLMKGGGKKSYASMVP